MAATMRLAFSPLSCLVVAASIAGSIVAGRPAKPPVPAPEAGTLKRVRGAVLAVLVAGLALGGILVSASGAERPARAHAYALVAAGSVGPHADVAARGASDEAHRSAGVDVNGLKIRSGQALARTDVTAGAA